MRHFCAGATSARRGLLLAIRGVLQQKSLAAKDWLDVPALYDYRTATFQ